MTLHELLSSMQDINVEVHYYKNHIEHKEGCPCKEIDYRSGSCTDVAISHLMKKNEVNWNNCIVFYVGFTTNRSRTLRINVEATDFND